MTAFLQVTDHDHLDGGTVPREWVVVSRTRPRDLLEAEWDWADSWDRYMAERPRPKGHIRVVAGGFTESRRPAGYDDRDAPVI